MRDKREWPNIHPSGSAYRSHLSAELGGVSVHLLTAATWSEIAAAVGTLALAGVTARMAKRTHDLATKTEEMAGATREMAAETKRVADASVIEAEATRQLVTEAQQDRSLAWSPYLTRSVERHIANPIGDPRGIAETITLTNLGKGQALRCYYFACDRGNVTLWGFAQHSGLVGEESVPLTTQAQYGHTPMELLELVPHDDHRVEAPFAAIFCEDVFGNRVRFLPELRTREVWHEGDVPVPSWATAPRVWS